MRKVAKVVAGLFLAVGVVGLSAPAQAAPAAVEISPSSAEVAVPAGIDEAAAAAAAATPALPASTTFGSDGGAGARAVCSYTGGHPNLYQGVQYQTAAVKHMQCLLKNFYGATYLVQDGNFGPLTRQVVVDFQRSHGLVQDGWIGPIGWNHLHPDSDAGLH